MREKKATELEHDAKGQFKPAVGQGNQQDDQNNGHVVKRVIPIEPSSDEPIAD